MLLVIDGTADSQHIPHTTGNSLLNTLIIRGRHYDLDTWFATQAYTRQRTQIKRNVK